MDDLNIYNSASNSATGHNTLNELVIPATAKLLCSPEILKDYLAVTVPEDFLYQDEESINSPSLAVQLADEGKGVMLFADGKPLSEIESQVGPKTTHLLLNGCQDDDMINFLEKTLPMIGDRLLVLDVSNTGLKRLPTSLCRCICLEELNISSNPFTRPWKNVGLGKSLSNLRILLANDCQFTVLPREIGELRGLKTLSLERNNLSHLPSWLYRLNQLNRLSLEGNPFQGAWQRICETFIPQEREVGELARPPFTRNVASAPSKMLAFHSTPCELEGVDANESSYDDLEEIMDPMPVTAPVVESLKHKEEKPARRPLIRRMMSSNGDNGLRSSPSTSLFDDDSSAASSLINAMARRPSVEADGVEKKWGTLMKKLTKKASNSTLMASSSTVSLEMSNNPSPLQSGSSSPVRKFSNPIRTEAPPPPKTKVTCPLTPVGWQDSSNESRLKKGFGENKANKRASFLAFSQDRLDVTHRRKLKALMQYLQDLDDLSALRVGPPGSVLPMETSMAAPQFSNTVTKATTSSNIDTHRSDSESSPESSTSDHSSTDPSDQSTPSCSEGKDDAQRRVRIVQEIISTEESYIRGLQELIDIYVLPSAGLDANSGQQVVPSSERRKVFGNIEGILHFHQGAFLPALQSATQFILNTSAGEMEELKKDQEAFNVLSASLVERVATVFSKHAAFFRMYSSYVNNVDAAQARVALWKLHKTSNNNGSGVVITNNSSQQPIDGSAVPTLTPKERKRIKAFLQRARVDPRHVQLSLETYLHLPVQRIPRYRLLFEDLVRNCPSYRLKDPTSITSALESIRSIATLMNESKRQSEKDRKLLEWQARVRGHFPSPLVQPHRRLIRDGNLSLKRVVMRTTAFHMSRNEMLEEESKECIEQDGAVTDTDLGIVQVDCLDQQCMDKSVNVLLCNDITVVVVQETVNQQSISTTNVNNNPVDLFAVLRIQKSVQIIGQTSELKSVAIDWSQDANSLLSSLSLYHHCSPTSRRPKTHIVFFSFFPRRGK